MLRFMRDVHGRSHGGILLTKQTPTASGDEGRPYHRFFDIDDWCRAVAGHQGEAGWFFSFSTFRGGAASTECLADLTACWLDLDWHKFPDLVARYGSPERILEAVDERCDKLGIPRPNRAHASGRGLLVVWQFGRTPAYGRSKSGERRDGPLVRWWVMQRYLTEAFADFNSDRQAMSPVHFFKLPGTLNAKSGATVAVMREPTDDKFGLFSMSSLYHVVEEVVRVGHARGELQTVSLPLAERKAASKANVTDLNARRAIKTGKAPKTAKRNADGCGADADAAATLIWSPRLRALVALAEHRARGGALLQGERNGLLFVIAVALSHVAGSRWRDEAVRLATQFTLGAWSEGEALARFSAVAKRIAKLERGETVTWQRQEVDPRYRMDDETVLGFAGVTEDEERLEFMRPLARVSIQADWKAKKLAETRRATRRRSDRAAPTTGLDRAGMSVKRKAEANARVARAHDLLTDGMTVAQIAQEMGQDPRVIRGYLVQTKSEPMDVPKPVPQVPVSKAAPQVVAAPSTKPAPSYMAQRLVYKDGCTEEEAAEELGVSVNQVRGWLLLKAAA